MSTIPFGDACRFWLKLGFVSFGGPAGQIAVMHQELVERRRWISEQRFLHALNYCMVLPGPEAQQLATYIGWLMHRTLGGIIAGLCFVLPSLIILTILSWTYMAYGHAPLVTGLLFGVKPAVVAIVFAAAYRIGTRVLRSAATLAIAAAALVSIFAFHVPFPVIVIAAGLIGYIGGRLAPASFAPAAAHSASATYGPALIDDDSPLPPHTQFKWKRAATVLALAVLLWIAAFAALGSMRDSLPALTQMAEFFSKAALVTFGGAYAVLPYVHQGAVEQYGWLTTLQMVDGLALGETTPGPLIMVVAFVGFVGAWTHVVPGEISPLLGGVLGALTATYFTFLPSFLFILCGAPLIESTRTNLKLNAALTAITAAVVGTIVNLAIFLAGHVFWPRGIQGQVEWEAALIAVVAAVALMRFKVGVIPIVIGSALAGIALSLW